MFQIHATNEIVAKIMSNGQIPRFYFSLKQHSKLGKRLKMKRRISGALELNPCCNLQDNHNEKKNTEH